MHAPHNVFRCRGEDAWVLASVVDDAAWLGLTPSDLAGLAERGVTGTQPAPSRRRAQPVSA